MFPPRTNKQSLLHVEFTTGFGFALPPPFPEGDHNDHPAAVLMLGVVRGVTDGSLAR